MSDEINPSLLRLILVMVFINLRSSLLPWSLALPLHGMLDESHLLAQVEFGLQLIQNTKKQDKE